MTPDQSAPTQPEGEEHPPSRHCRCAFCVDYFKPDQNAQPDATERAQKLTRHSKAFFRALADLVNLASRNIKGDNLEREWIDREQAMRLVPALRDHGSAMAAIAQDELRYHILARPPAGPHSTEDLRQMLVILNENDPARWEIGFRNIVAILLGPRTKFEISDVVEQVRALASPPPSPSVEVLREAAIKALDALVLGRDAALQVAAEYHASMKGYRPDAHALLDAEAEQISAAIATLEAAIGGKTE